MGNVVKFVSPALEAASRNVRELVRSASHRYGAQSAEAGRLGAALHRAAMGALTRAVGQAIPFATRNGFEVVEARTGYLRARIALKGNRNHIGTMYAGALFTVAELPGGIICMLDFGENFYPVLKEMQVQYLDVARSDVEVEYEIKVEEMRRIENAAAAEGKCDFILEGDLKNKDGKVVARSKGFYQLRMK